MKVATPEEQRHIALRNALHGYQPRDEDERASLAEARAELLTTAIETLRAKCLSGIRSREFTFARRRFVARAHDDGSVRVEYAGNLLVFSAPGVLQ